jgi:Holliday junction resolvase
LSTLNSIFEGKATGETFSKKGKTDIYLNIDKGSILVFECKIWAGEKLYQETIDQVRRYLTWRHNFGVMITFAKNKDFSNILKNAKETIQNSTSYVSGFRVIDETHFISIHKIEDDGKEVEIHHLFYNLHV